MKLLPYDARHIRKKTTTGALDLGHTRAVVLDIFEEEFHAQRVMSIANAVAGALKAAGAGIHAIGQGYAELAQIDPKHGVKQVDRLLSNSAVRVDDALAAWCRYAVGDHSSIVIALDWTEFAPDSHSTLFAALVTVKGRALPLAWRTVTREKLKGSQTEIEERFIEDLHNWLPKETAITVLADRGFAKMSLCKLLSVLGWDYVIRCKQDYLVTDSSGHTCKIGDLIPAKGRIGWVTDALVTAASEVLVREVRRHSQTRARLNSLCRFYTPKTSRLIHLPDAPSAMTGSPHLVATSRWPWMSTGRRTVRGTPILWLRSTRRFAPSMTGPDKQGLSF